MGNFEEALRLAPLRQGADQVSSYYRPDRGTLVLASIGASQGKAGYADKARETFREALDLVRGDPRLSTRLGQIALCQAEAGDYPGALKTVERVPPEQRIRLLTEIADKQNESGDHEGARITFRAALEQAERLLRDSPLPRNSSRAGGGAVTNHVDKIVPGDMTTRDLQWIDGQLAQVVALHAKSGNVKDAMKTLELISLPDCRGWAARDIAEAQTKAGDATGAITWALSLHPSERAWAIRGLATGSLAHK